jgi:hypothetical protein
MGDTENLPMGTERNFIQGRKLVFPERSRRAGQKLNRGSSVQPLDKGLSMAVLWEAHNVGCRELRE